MMITLNSARIPAVSVDYLGKLVFVLQLKTLNWLIKERRGFQSEMFKKVHGPFPPTKLKLVPEKRNYLSKRE